MIDQLELHKYNHAVIDLRNYMKLGPRTRRQLENYLAFYWPLSSTKENWSEGIIAEALRKKETK